MRPKVSCRECAGDGWREGGGSVWHRHTAQRLETTITFCTNEYSKGIQRVIISAIYSTIPLCRGAHPLRKW